MANIAILGAGLIGRMLAVSLMRDYQITLYDQDDGSAKDSAAYLAAAMLAPLAESADSSANIMAMGERALKLWPIFLAQLSTPVFFQKSGSLILAFEQDLGDLEQFKKRLKGADFVEITTNEMLSLEPELNRRFSQGLFLEHEGQLDNRQLLQALKVELQGGQVCWHSQSEISFEDGVYRCNGSALGHFDWIFDCRGLGIKADTELTAAKGLRGVRGEVIRLSAPDVKLTRPVRLMHPRYPLYIAPKENGQFVVGATQIESEDQRQPTVRSALELLSACFSVHSGFAEAEILAIESGLRPAYRDNEPKITVADKVVTVNGLYRHGYLLAPVMVEACQKILQGLPFKLEESTPLIEHQSNENREKCYASLYQ